MWTITPVGYLCSSMSAASGLENLNRTRKTKPELHQGFAKVSLNATEAKTFGSSNSSVWTSIVNM